MPHTLTAPLAVAATTTDCSAKGEHPIRIVTDGLTSYAYGQFAGGTDCGPAYRDHTTITVTCAQNTGPGPDGEPCQGEATFDLSTPGVWTGDAEAIRHLLTYGEPVEA